MIATTSSSSASARTHSLVIRLPEGVDFALPLAGPMSRFLARSIDFMAELSLVWLFRTVLGVIVPLAPDVGMAVIVLAYFLVPVLYGIACEWGLRGQTLGKRVLKLRVMDAGGLRLRFSQIVLRNLLRVVDSLPAAYLLGGAACLMSRRCQRLGDLAAGTIVVRLPRLEAVELARLGLDFKFNSLREKPVLAARLRQAIDPADANIALLALLRRDQLDAGPRVEIFAALAAHFRSLVSLPEELTLDLSDEAFVRNVVDIVFQAREQQAREKRVEASERQRFERPSA